MTATRSHRIGEIANATGVTVETVRYYEQQGLLPKAHRSAAGARRFSEDVIARVRFIKQAQAAGLTLKDIQILVVSRNGASRVACQKIRSVLAVRVADLDERMAELQTFRSMLADHLRKCDQALAVSVDVDCPTIDAIACGGGSVRS